MSEELKFVACPHDGCLGLWLPPNKVVSLRLNGATFYCSAGHSMSFTDTTQAQLDKALRDVEYYRKAYIDLSAEKKCPVCFQRFKRDCDLTRHIRTKQGWCREGETKP